MTNTAIRLLQPADAAMVEAFLADHAASSMILRANLRRSGLAGGDVPFCGVYGGRFLNGALVGVAAHYWNGVLFLQDPDDPTGSLAAATAAASGRGVAGLFGPWDQVTAAQTALGFKDTPTRTCHREILYRLALDQVIEPPLPTVPAHRVRPIEAGDFSWLLDQQMAYLGEALGQIDTPATRHAARDGLVIAEQAGDHFLLTVDGAPVAMAAFNARLPDMVQVGGVFTPPENRNRGYAKITVAGALLHARNQGVDTAILFTDQHNHPAQRVYESLGFTAIGDYGIVFFTP